MLGLEVVHERVKVRECNAAAAVVATLVRTGNEESEQKKTKQLTRSRSGKELGAEPTPSNDPDRPSKLSYPKTSTSLLAIAMALAPVLAPVCTPLALTTAPEFEELRARRGRLKDGMLLGRGLVCGCRGAKQYCKQDVETRAIEQDV